MNQKMRENSISEIFVNHPSMKLLKVISRELKSIEENFGKAIEFESRRISSLEKENNELKTMCNDLQKRVNSLENSMEKHREAVNKQERFSRRTNIRIVGYPEK